jgi:Ycf66 protein N-terminus
MVNFGGGAASLLGIFLMVAGAGLYFLRSIRPEVSRDHDILFAAVGLLCGAILLFQGWRLDPILLFGQVLMSGSAIWFTFETIRLRGVTTEVVKRNTPIVDDDRPVSRNYRAYDQEAELYDQPELDEERYENRRLRGYDEPRNSRSDRYEGEVRRPKNRSNSDRTSERGNSDRSVARSSKRRSRPPSNRPQERSEDSWDAQVDTSISSWEDKPRSSRPRTSTRPENRDLETDSKPRKRRPSPDRVSSPPTRDEEATPADYVDYQPIDDDPEAERDKPERFDY